MRKYETIFVVDTALDGDAVESEIDRVVKLIEDKKGKVHDVERWGRRRLAYPIQDKPEGVYTLVRFDGPAEVLSEMNRRFSLNESMLRHMTILVEHPDGPKAAPEGVRREAARHGETEAPASTPEPAAAPGEGAAKNESK